MATTVLCVFSAFLVLLLAFFFCLLRSHLHRTTMGAFEKKTTKIYMFSPFYRFFRFVYRFHWSNSQRSMGALCILSRLRSSKCLNFYNKISKSLQRNTETEISAIYYVRTAYYYSTHHNASSSHGSVHLDVYYFYEIVITLDHHISLVVDRFII